MSTLQHCRDTECEGERKMQHHLVIESAKLHVARFKTCICFGNPISLYRGVTYLKQQIIEIVDHTLVKNKCISVTSVPVGKKFQDFVKRKTLCVTRKLNRIYAYIYIYVKINTYQIKSLIKKCL